MFQRWSDLLFLHWEVEADAIQRRLPPGLHADTFGGRAWIGVVPFFMERIRPAGLPAFPGLSWFLELNVRTYVHDGRGRPGVWFFSLECNQPLAVEIARRAFHLPYQHAWMKASVRDGWIGYHCRRRVKDTVPAEFRYRPAVDGGEASPGSLEWFLVERYLLFSSDRRGALHCGRVHHRPYRIRTGECDRWSAEPLRLNGFGGLDGEPASVLVAETVDVSVFPLKACGSA